MARKIVLSEKAVAFRAGDGQEIIYLTGMPIGDGQAVHSPDGQIYYELVVGGFGGTSAEHDLSFEDPNSGRQGRWHRAGDELLLDGVTFAKVATPSEITLESLPSTRKPVSFFRMCDGRYVYISADAYNDSDESFRLFIGDDLKEMRETTVTGVSRPPREGGPILVETPDGWTFAPPPHNPGAKPAWYEEDIELLDPRQFTISESTAGVTIDPR